MAEKRRLELLRRLTRPTPLAGTRKPLKIKALRGNCQQRANNRETIPSSSNKRNNKAPDLIKGPFFYSIPAISSPMAPDTDVPRSCALRLIFAIVDAGSEIVSVSVLSSSATSPNSVS